jgi:hypothetical protein
MKTFAVHNVCHLIISPPPLRLALLHFCSSDFVLESDWPGRYSDGPASSPGKVNFVLVCKSAVQHRIQWVRQRSTRWPLSTMQRSTRWPLSTMQCPTRWPLSTMQCPTRWPLSTMQCQCPYPFIFPCSMVLVSRVEAVVRNVPSLRVVAKPGYSKHHFSLRNI